MNDELDEDTFGETDFADLPGYKKPEDPADRYRTEEITVVPTPPNIEPTIDDTNVFESGDYVFFYKMLKSVRNGEWGDGEDRFDNLTAAGFTNAAAAGLLKEADT